MMRLRTAMLTALLALGTTVTAATPKPDVPEGFHLKGSSTYVHDASGTQFPLKVAGFTRFSSKPYDLIGHDIAVSYREQIDGQTIAVRIAMIHILEMTPKEHYIGIKALVGSYYPDLTFTDVAEAGEGPFTPPGMKEGSGYQGRFRAMQGETPYELSLSTLKLGKWDVRITAAYPSSAKEKAQKDVLKLAAVLKRTAPKH